MSANLRGSRDGMTLVELIAAMAVGLLLVLAAGKALIFCEDISGKSTEKNQEDMMLRAVELLLEKELADAKEVEVSRHEVPVIVSEHELVFTKEGKIEKDGREVFEDYFYGGRHITLWMETPGTDSEVYFLYYKLFLKDQESPFRQGSEESTENKSFYSESSVIQLLNLKLEGRSVVYSGETERIWNSDEGNIYLYYR